MNDSLLPQIDAVRCTGCERCIEICPTQALAQIHGKAMLLYPDRCIYCTFCEDICPADAIALPFLIVFAGCQRPEDKVGKF
ncbi:4Fe-4S binding protein [Caldilinea sp.]|jgi:formate hydrogenlyase subunit 6/NADH:ubiquinone oxidoreductase subunit I|uniref:ATP-binding protein n=1 Tax=Caldilinea sp. TaxID=2293560 RepID=UPI001B0CBFDC|nr:4Fe-4S binding protein [Caldilinea sp.]MBO9391603.1 4Fe-4S binding protein [Caldilinea sp.]